MNSKQAKRIPIQDFLSHLGYLPQREDRNGTWYFTMLAVSERTPSFQVSRDGCAFHDWSTGAKGSIVELALAILGRNDVSAALAHIESTMGRPASMIVPTPKSFSVYQQKKKSGDFGCG